MIEFDIAPETSEICVKSTTNCRKIRDTCVTVFLAAPLPDEVLPEAQRLEAADTARTLADPANTTATLVDDATTSTTTTATSSTPTSTDTSIQVREKINLILKIVTS